MSTNIGKKINTNMGKEINVASGEYWSKYIWAPAIWKKVLLKSVGKEWLFQDMVLEENKNRTVSSQHKVNSVCTKSTT